MSIHKFDIDADDAALFKDVHFMVAANDNERQMLWEQWHYRPTDGMKAIPWEQINPGHIVTIGKVRLGGLRGHVFPVCVNIAYARVHGKKIMMYWPCSLIVDHKMVEDWRNYWFQRAGTQTKSGLCHTNGMNFHICEQALR